MNYELSLVNYEFMFGQLGGGGSFQGHSGIISGHSGIIPGSFQGHSRTSLGSFRDHSGVILGLFWDHSRIIPRSFQQMLGVRCSMLECWMFDVMFGQIYVLFCSVFGYHVLVFGDVFDPNVCSCWANGVRHQPCKSDQKCGAVVNVPGSPRFGSVPNGSAT